MANPQAMNYPRRGEVYLVNFDPTVGSEIRKTRPAVIVQNDVSNRYSSVTIVCAITSRIHEEPYPVEVRVAQGEGGMRVDSVIRTDHIRTVDRRRLLRKLGTLTSATVARVDRALQISLGLVVI